MSATAALVPALLALDLRVLDALAADRGLRADRVAQLVHGAPDYRCNVCGDTSRGAVRTVARDPLGWEARPPLLCPRLMPPRTDDQPAEWCKGRRIAILVTTPGQCREVREILRGLERVGLAQQAGGWWRRVR